MVDTRDRTETTFELCYSFLETSGFIVRFKYFLFYLLSPVFIVAESSIVKAFRDGSLHSQIKLFSYDIEKETDEDAYANAIGGHLKYSTDTSQML